MTKTICDICGKEIGNAIIPRSSPEDQLFNLTRYGKNLDVCQECRDSLWLWVKERRKEI